MKKMFFLVLSLAVLPVSAQTTRHVCGTDFIRQLEKRGILPVNPTNNIRRISALPRAGQVYKVGDTHEFWTYDLSVMPPKNVKISATCRGVGPHSYVFVADDQWGSAVDQAKVDAILKAFEQSTPVSPDKGIYETDTTVFGDPPDVDGDPRIILFVYKIAGYNGYKFDGFFRDQDEKPFDPACETTMGAYCSNAAEMLHLNTEGIGSDYMNGVIAHEFQHMIHYNYDPAEVSWLNEGMSELAMTLNGYKDQQNLDAFTKTHDAALIPSGQHTVDYGAVMLFGVYFYENFPNLVKALVQDTKHGIDSVNDLLAQQKLDFPGFFTSMAAAMFADDPDVWDSLGLKLGFGMLDYAQTHADAVVNVDSSQDNGAIQLNFDVLPYTFKYVRIDGVDKTKILKIDGPGQGNLRFCLMGLSSDPANGFASCQAMGDDFVSAGPSLLSKVGAIYLVLANADVTAWVKPYLKWSLLDSPDTAENTPEQAGIDANTSVDAYASGDSNSNSQGDVSNGDNEFQSGAGPACSSCSAVPVGTGTANPYMLFLSLMLLAGLLAFRFRIHRHAAPANGHGHGPRDQ